MTRVRWMGGLVATAALLSACSSSSGSSDTTPGSAGTGGSAGSSEIDSGQAGTGPSGSAGSAGVSTDASSGDVSQSVVLTDATDATVTQDTAVDSFDPLDVSFAYDAPVHDSNLSSDSACANVSAEATKIKRPMDIIFIVDNSGSMSAEIKAIQDNISINFASIIQSAGVDYRVIMIAEHGPLSAQSICISKPLNSTDCPSNLANNKAPSINPPIFFHYDNNDVESLDSLCKMRRWFTQADRYNLAPTGWQGWLRPEAFKIFVEVTDDDVSCTPTGDSAYNDNNTAAGGNAVAKAFDEDLLAMSPAQFGTAQKRNYIWHSLIGLTAKNPAGDPWLPTDPITTSRCSTSSGPGTGYQGLSILTGGLRFPVCEGSGFSKVFEVIAQGVIEGSAVACEFGIPPLEHGTIDRNQVLVEYTPGNGGAVEKFSPVQNEAACGGGDGFYFDDATTKITLCPATCQRVQADDKAKIQLLLGCYGS